MVWAGLDPYAAPGFFDHPFLNPPSALPLFAAFATLPLAVLVPAWKAFVSLAALGLIPLAARAPASQADPQPGPGDPPPLRGGEVGCLAAVFAISDTATADMQLGQLGCLTALALTAAVWAQGRRRPILAGLCLAVATLKVGTMLPALLLLFPRRADLRSWVALIVAVAALCLLPGHVSEFPTRLGEMLTHLRELSGPGQPNDITFAGPQAVSIVGFEHTAYRLGIRDLRMASMAQFAALGLLGASLAAVVWRSRVPRPAACALVMLYAFVFLYHRVYDALVLAIPLTYAVALARSARGWRRVASGLASLTMLTILYMRRKPMQAASDWSTRHAMAGRLVQAIVLPYATWAVLLSMACLLAATWKAGRPRP